MKAGLIMEWAPFTLRAGVSEESLLSASDEIQKNFLEKQAGFIQRRLVKKGPDSYIDVLEWRDQSALDEAMRQVNMSSSCMKYFALMQMNEDDPHGGMMQFQILSSYTSF